MKKHYVGLAVLSTLLLPSTIMASGTGASGGVKLGVRGLDDTKASAKFQEYRDLDDGAFGKIWLDSFTRGYFFGIEGKNMGLDDQSYTFSGGRYGQFKYAFAYDETPHNYAFNAKTPYTGIGTNVLTYGAAAPAVANWKTFDFAIKKKKYGGDLEVSLKEPFYFAVGVERNESKGVKPLFVSDRGAEGVEIPEPIDQVTDNFTMRAGYSTGEYLFEINGLLSSFDNEYDIVGRQDMLAPAVMNYASMAPENDYRKLGLKFARKHLPYNSTLAASASYATLENDLTIDPVLLAANPAYTRTFSGDISYTNISTTLSSRPTKELNTKVYFAYLDKENDASAMRTDDVNTFEKFQFDKTTAGVEASYNLPRKTKLTGGYDFSDTNRHDRPEFQGTTDHSMTVKVRNNLLEKLTLKAQYQRLMRTYDTDNARLIHLAHPPDPTSYIKVSDFDANGKKMDKIKLGMEILPHDNVDLGLEYTFTKNDYDQPMTAEPDNTPDILENPGIRARQKDDRHGLNLDFLLRLPRQAQLSGYVGYEKRTVKSQVQNGTAPYSQSVEDDLWAYGLTGKMPFMDNKLNIIVGWDYQKSDGESEFGIATNLANIASVADYSKHRLDAKAVYSYTRMMDFTVGYQYEKYEYTDYSYSGFIHNTTALLAPTDLFFSGAYADQDYESNLGYLLVKYGF